MEVDIFKLGGMREWWRSQSGRAELEGVSALGY